MTHDVQPAKGNTRLLFVLLMCLVYCAPNKPKSTVYGDYISAITSTSRMWNNSFVQLFIVIDYKSKTTSIITRPLALLGAPIVTRPFYMQVAVLMCTYDTVYVTVNSESETGLSHSCIWTQFTGFFHFTKLFCELWMKFMSYGANANRTKAYNAKYGVLTSVDISGDLSRRPRFWDLFWHARFLLPHVQNFVHFRPACLQGQAPLPLSLLQTLLQIHVTGSDAYLSPANCSETSVVVF